MKISTIREALTKDLNAIEDRLSESRKALGELANIEASYPQTEAELEAIERTLEAADLLCLGGYPDHAGQIGASDIDQERRRTLKECVVQLKSLRSRKDWGAGDWRPKGAPQS